MSNRLAYSTSEAAEVLGVSRPTIYTLIKRDDFPSFTVGTRRLIPVEELREWVKNQVDNQKSA